MCRKAQNVQIAFHGKPEDIVFAKFGHDFDITAPWALVYGLDKLGTVIWLPGQNQLQAMLLKRKGVAFESGRDTITYLYGLQKTFIEGDSAQAFHSMDQLWLGIVMSQLYKKVWSESDLDWVDA
jgi:hypothetical protein